MVIEVAVLLFSSGLHLPPWQSSKAIRKFQKSTTWSASAMSGDRGGRRRQNAASPSASKPQ